MADSTGKRNPIKIMLIVSIVLMLAILAVVLFKNDKVMLEDEQGATLVGASGKFLKTDEE